MHYINNTIPGTGMTPLRFLPSLKFRLSLFLILFLFSISYAADEVERVQIRSAPQKRTVISGRIDPMLQIEIDVLYTTTKKNCRRTTNWLEGAESDRVYRVSYPVQRVSGKYEVIVDLDKLEPGRCAWKPYSINYTVKKNEIMQKVPVPPTPLTWVTDEGQETLSEFDVECSEGLFREQRMLSCLKQRRSYLININAKIITANFLMRASSEAKKRAKE